MPDQPQGPKSRQRIVDPRPRGDHSDYLAMLRRMLRAGARRLATADPDDLAEMVALRDDLDQAILQAIAGQRAAGTSWEAIGAPLGLSKQGAQQRYGRKLAELEALP